MEKILLIVGFLLLRYFLTAKKDKKKEGSIPTSTANPQTETPINIEDIFGDFMKDLNQEKTPKTLTKTVSNQTKPIVNQTKPVSNQAKKDFHRAEDDSNKKLDWQQVVKSKSADVKQMTFKDYNQVSHSNIKDEPLEVAEIAVTPKNIVEIDLKQAILYKEILERKYFTV